MQPDQNAALASTPLPLRPDTMLGVCEALGQDFGFHPNLLRIALGSVVLFSPLVAIAIYLGLGVVVAISRLLAPPRREAVRFAPQIAPVAETVEEELPLAA